jgi:hypothetical protein
LQQHINPFPRTLPSLATARQLHSSQCRDELFVSGYYWSPPTTVRTEHCVPKLAFALADNNLAGLMKFCTILHACLNACGLTPIYCPYYRVSALMLTLSALVVGIGNEPANL